MNELTRFVRTHSIDNLRLGRVVARSADRCTVRVGITEVVCWFSGDAAVGDVVALECPDGELAKGRVVGRSAFILAEGGNVIL